MWTEVVVRRADRSQNPSFALKRSCLISCSQPAGGRIWNFGRQAGWNETERQARRCGRWNLGTTDRRWLFLPRASRYRIQDRTLLHLVTGPKVVNCLPKRHPFGERVDKPVPFFE